MKRTFILIIFTVLALLGKCPEVHDQKWLHQLFFAYPYGRHKG